LIYGNHPNIITTAGITLIVTTGIIAAVGLSAAEGQMLTRLDIWAG
jgi:hypothetical protein